MAEPTDPAPKQPGLTAAQQRRIDAHNYDYLAAAAEHGEELTAGETATWRALAERLGRPDPLA